MTEPAGENPPEPRAGERQLPLEQPPAEDLPAAICALLFVASEPVPIDVLAQHLGCDAAAARRALDVAAARLDGVGLVVQWCDDAQVQLATAPRFAQTLQRFLGLERTVRLSQAALETLAIVAYRQPVTRSDLDRTRGVDSSGVLQTLIARGLVEPVGRLAAVGNPIQYATTPEFLRFFGLSSLEDLPPPADGIEESGGARPGDESQARDEERGG